MPVGNHVDSPRVAERHHAEVQFDPLAAHHGVELAEVDLELLAGWRLEPNRCLRFGTELLPKPYHRALYGPDGHRYAVLSPKLLLHNRLKIVFYSF